MNKMEKYFSPKFGLIAQGPPNRDGGDSCQRCGMYYFGLRVREKFRISNNDWFLSHGIHFIAQVECYVSDYGLLRRHPDKDKWYGDWNRGSRDQTIPMIVSLGIHSHYVDAKYYLKKLFWRRAKKLWLFTDNTIDNAVYDTWSVRADGNYKLDGTIEKIKFYFGWRPKDANGKKEKVYAPKLPDFTGPEFHGLFIRSFRNYWFYLYLFVSDIETLVGAIHRRLNSDNDVLNHCIVSVNGSLNLPTPIMFLANQINDWDDLAKKMKEYFHKTPIEVEEMWDLWEPILKEMKRRQSATWYSRMVRCVISPLLSLLHYLFGPKKS